MKNISVKIDGVMVLTFLAVAGAGFVYVKRAEIVSKINPANENNFINQAVVGAVGQETVSNTADRVFGAIDLINPFNESDAYAKQVYNL